MNKKRKLMKPPHPGKFIHENLRDLWLNVELAAAALGVHPATVLDLVTEQAALSPETAMRIEKAFGLSMDILLRMQACHGQRKST